MMLFMLWSTSACTVIEGRQWNTVGCLYCKGAGGLIAWRHLPIFAGFAEVGGGTGEWCFMACALGYQGFVLQIAPKEDETKALQAYAGPVNELSEPEQFLLVMSTIPRLTAKLNVLILIQQFEVPSLSLPSKPPPAIPPAPGNMHKEAICCRRCAASRCTFSLVRASKPLTDFAV